MARTKKCLFLFNNSFGQDDLNQVGKLLPTTLKVM